MTCSDPARMDGRPPERTWIRAAFERPGRTTRTDYGTTRGAAAQLGQLRGPSRPTRPRVARRPSARPVCPARCTLRDVGERSAPQGAALAFPRMRKDHAVLAHAGAGPPARALRCGLGVATAAIGLERMGRDGLQRAARPGENALDVSLCNAKTHAPEFSCHPTGEWNPSCSGDNRERGRGRRWLNRPFSAQLPRLQLRLLSSPKTRADEPSVFSHPVRAPEEPFEDLR